MKPATEVSSDEALALRLAIANLLRAAVADLTDAQALLRKQSSRNAAALLRQAVTHIITAVAASEHGWPLAEWNAGLRAVPEANTLQPDLVEVDSLASAMTGPAVQADGQLRQAPDSQRISQALRRADSILDIVGNAVDIDMAGVDPARRVARIRPDPAPDSPPAAAPTVRRGRSSRLPPAPIKRLAEDVPAPTVVRLPERQAMCDRCRTDAAPRSDADSLPVEKPYAQRAAASVSSTAFWSLMERWKVADPTALALIGHRGGLTRKGTRPRFRVVGPEAKLFGYLREIDAALMPLRHKPAQWITQPIPDKPFNGATPLAHITDNGLAGARDVIHRIMAVGLRQRK